MNTCPHCGMPATLAAEFACGSQRRGNEVARFWRCYEIEIGKKDARITTMTAAGQHAERELQQWKEYAEKLEAIGNQMAAERNKEAGPDWEDSLARMWRLEKGRKP